MKNRNLDVVVADRRIQAGACYPRILPKAREDELNDAGLRICDCGSCQDFANSEFFMAGTGCYAPVSGGYVWALEEYLCERIQEMTSHLDLTLLYGYLQKCVKLSPATRDNLLLNIQQSL